MSDAGSSSAYVGALAVLAGVLVTGALGFVKDYFTNRRQDRLRFLDERRQAYRTFVAKCDALNRAVVNAPRDGAESAARAVERVHELMQSDTREDLEKERVLATLNSEAHGRVVDALDEAAAAMADIQLLAPGSVISAAIAHWGAAQEGQRMAKTFATFMAVCRKDLGVPELKGVGV